MSYYNLFWPKLFIYRGKSLKNYTVSILLLIISVFLNSLTIFSVQAENDEQVSPAEIVKSSLVLIVSEDKQESATGFFIASDTGIFTVLTTGEMDRNNESLNLFQGDVNIASSADFQMISDTDMESNLAVKKSPSLTQILGILSIGLCLGGIGLFTWLKLKNKSPQKTDQVSTDKPQIEIKSFTTVTVDERGEIIQENPQENQYFQEKIDENISIDMAYIPGGLFKIGSGNEEGDEREKPRHEVIIKPFFMGKYPITQAQWQAVTLLPKIRRELEPNPAKFKGDNLPIENVSWYDAVEFCQRLSALSGREYRLPSESEWEYACRAQTNTPFYFGPTITSNIANYKAIFSYGKERKGKDRHLTTPVGEFPPNSFGLYDLHGNVGEWCADSWHDDYQNAPQDGSPWIKNTNQEYRVSSPVRGGAWIATPNDCRSASRKGEKRDRTNSYTGFRVVCEWAEFKLK